MSYTQCFSKFFKLSREFVKHKDSWAPFTETLIHCVLGCPGGCLPGEIGLQIMLTDPGSRC